MPHTSAIKPAGFGTFKGVFVPSLLTILGVIMYLRMGWVVGNVGLEGTLLIVTLASLITFLTGLAISATATNMKVGAGGAYFMISRSFGIEAGAAIGLPLYFAQALGISFYIAGFSESVFALTGSTLPFVNPQIIGSVVLILLSALAFKSADLALRAQYVILAIIVLSLFSLFLGSAPETAPLVEESVSGRAPFWLVFAVFFPAVTGIEAGISMSGNLKNPGRSLPIGTLAAVVVGYLVYLAIPIFLNRMAPMQVLRDDPLIMQKVALFGPLIMLGIWGATLSSALGALLGAPRTLQALSRDRVLPSFLGKSFGADDSPQIATLLSCAVALAGIWLGDLNAIAPVLSMFFLTSYGFLNLAAGLEALMGNPSWRPKFKTPWILSLLGAFACFATMFMIDAGATFVAAFCSIAIFVITKKRGLGKHLSDIRYGLLVFLARFSVERLSTFSVNARSWRPHIMIFTASPNSGWPLIELAHSIIQGKGFLIVSSVLKTASISRERLLGMESSVRSHLASRGIPALVEMSTSDSTMRGLRSLVQNYGLGPLSPNTFFMGQGDSEQNYCDIADLLRLVHGSGRNAVLLQESGGTSSTSIEKAPAFSLFRKRPKKHIDIWWGRQKQNAGLMLALSYMLQTSKAWRGAEISLRSLAHRPQEQEKAQHHLEEFLAEGRLLVHAAVHLQNPEEPLFEAIAKHSAHADLVLIGLRPPNPDESDESYRAYYADLIKQTRGIKNVVIVMAGESVPFHEIFI
jgi:solute carrier family 12 (sodium/potassium/chloride transporter), member 2